jgi:hypothetical protein
MVDAHDVGMQFKCAYPSELLKEFYISVVRNEEEVEDLAVHGPPRRRVGEV